jgi:hypothetical protein
VSQRTDRRGVIGHPAPVPATDSRVTREQDSRTLLVRAHLAFGVAAKRKSNLRRNAICTPCLRRPVLQHLNFAEIKC